MSHEMAVVDLEGSVVIVSEVTPVSSLYLFCVVGFSPT